MFSTPCQGFHAKSALSAADNPKGDGMIFAHTILPATNTSYMAYGFVPAPKANGKRDDYFNEEDFTSGGLEAGFSYNQAGDGGYLNTQNDYGQMDHQVSCTYSGLGNNALEFQIFDNSTSNSSHLFFAFSREDSADLYIDHHGTIAAGNIRAYQSGTYDIGSLSDPIDAPLPEQPGCQVS